MTLVCYRLNDSTMKIYFKCLEFYKHNKFIITEIEELKNKRTKTEEALTYCKKKRLTLEKETRYPKLSNKIKLSMSIAYTEILKHMGIRT